MNHQLKAWALALGGNTLLAMVAGIMIHATTTAEVNLPLFVCGYWVFWLTRQFLLYLHNEMHGEEQEAEFNRAVYTALFAALQDEEGEDKVGQ
jgi:hypothetical protein